MTSEHQPVIAVVIPNYNGAATIDETLLSVRSQTWRSLDILVVDDGSTDDSRSHIATHIAADPRVRLLSQANAGVAAARNHGWRASTAEWVAFIDSDDLWAQDKLARQFEALAGAGANAGLAYCGYASIDAKGHVIECRRPLAFSGNVLDRLMLGNFVANGSAALVRRWVLERTGGFESALHRAGAQGCEDYLFYLRAAEQCEFAVVAAPLVGYRQLPGAMSANGPRMLRSWRMAMMELATRHPERRSTLRLGYRNYAAWLSRRTMFARQPFQLTVNLLTIARHDPGVAAWIALKALPLALLKAVRPGEHDEESAIAPSGHLAPGARYPIGDPL